MRGRCCVRLPCAAQAHITASHATFLVATLLIDERSRRSCRTDCMRLACEEVFNHGIRDHIGRLTPVHTEHTVYDITGCQSCQNTLYLRMLHCELTLPLLDIHAIVRAQSVRSSLYPRDRGSDVNFNENDHHPCVGHEPVHAQADLAQR